MDFSGINLSNIPQHIEGIGNKCVKGLVELSEHACTNIQNCINNVRTLSNNISFKSRVIKETIVNKFENFFYKGPTMGKVCEDLGIKHENFCNYPESLKKAVVDYVVSSNNDNSDSSDQLSLAKKLAGELKQYEEKISKEVPESPKTKEIKDFLSKIEKDIKKLETEDKQEQSTDGKTAKEIIHTKIDNIKNFFHETISNIHNTIKDFFDKSPTTGEICKDLGIDQEDFCKYSEPLQKAIVKCAISSDMEDGDNSYQLSLAKKLAEELNKEEKTKEIKDFLSHIEEIIKKQVSANEINEENIKGSKVGTESQGTIKTKEGKTINEINETFDGKPILTETTLSIGMSSVTVKTETIPQIQLSGFGEDKDIKLCSSMSGGKLEHATNLWKQSITVGDQNISFIRCGNTRGKESASKEILANALSLKFSEDQIRGADSPDKPLILNFSNIQLMTPGGIDKITDKNMPFAQMDTFKKLAAGELLGTDLKPIEGLLALDYKGKTVYVKLEPPLLFNFGTNAQWFSKVFNPVVNFKDTIARNDESFRQLFGNFEIFGGQGSEQKVNEHYTFDDTSIIGKKLKELNDENDKELKEQIQSLADQIIDIYSQSKQGVSQNPYALASRVALLTNLLGYATSYGCKSGKDRTGVMAMEMENLTAKFLSDGKPYDPYTESEEEKKNLQSIYKAGTSIKIAKINRGGKQNKLKIEKLGFLFTSLDDRFGVDLAKNFEKNVKKLK